MNILNVNDIERELSLAAAHAYYPQAQEWIGTVARNYIVSKASDKDIETNYRVYNPVSPGLDMPEASSLPAWATNALKRGETLHWFDPIQTRRRTFWHMLDAIVDWFNDWNAEDPRLARLSKINFQVASTAATLWSGKVSTNLWDYVKDKPPVIKTYENGFHWVLMTTRLHFERESMKMNHCIYSGSYYSAFKQGNAEFYSLRDGHNTPHATIEVRADEAKSKSKSVRQCKGNSNAKPSSKYQPYIKRFFNDMKWKVAGDSNNID